MCITEREREEREWRERRKNRVVKSVPLGVEIDCLWELEFEQIRFRDSLG